MRILPACASALAMAFADGARAQSPEARPVTGPTLVGGFHVGAPQKVSTSVGLVVPWSVRGAAFTGYAIFAEPGLAGGRLSLGVVRDGGPSGFTMQLRASAIRTWWRPWRAATHQTFVGPEVRLGIVEMTMGAGYFWNVSSPAWGRHRLFAVSAGFGY